MAKLFKKMLKTKSLDAYEKTDDIKVLEKLGDIVQPLLTSTFKKMDEKPNICMAHALKSRPDLTIKEQNFLLYMYTKYWYKIHPDKLLKN
ncbi:unnamed protein product [Phytophthora lilii]|uniref:Unnamed protein product n=1 Tax=Phytophthora lilii TaxID=2077276 RepID=A0A9W6X6T3_9STRA|nr:unnamed protein product [Phytophthora lilii]